MARPLNSVQFLEGVVSQNCGHNHKGCAGLAGRFILFNFRLRTHALLPIVAHFDPGEENNTQLSIFTIPKGFGLIRLWAQS